MLWDPVIFFDLRGSEFGQGNSLCGSRLGRGKQASVQLVGGTLGAFWYAPDLTTQNSC